MSLEYAALWWLAYEKKCHYVLEQRSPRYGLGSPDIIGVTQGRYLTEIEIKRSASDFRADAKKHHRINQITRREIRPRQLYYLMPEKLAVKMLDEIPEHAGLMTVRNGRYIKIIRNAPVNKESGKLTLKECVRLCRQMTNHMMSYALTVRQVYDGTKYIFTFEDWVEVEKGTYQI